MTGCTTKQWVRRGPTGLLGRAISNVQDKLRRMPQVALSVFRYVAVGIHYLLRQHHEVAGSRAGLAWDEERPASASKIVTLTTSPMPSVIPLGGSRRKTHSERWPRTHVDKMQRANKVKNKVKM